MDFDFSVTESLAAFKDADKHSFNVENADNLLSQVTEELALRTESIGQFAIFDPLETLALGYLKLPVNLQYQLCYLISSSLKHQAENTNVILESGDVEQFVLYKKLLELYGYLAHCILTLTAMDESIASASKSRGSSLTNQQKKHIKNANSQIADGLEAITVVLKLSLSRLFQTTPERNTFVGLFTSAVFSVLENEDRAKELSIKMYSFKVLSMAVKFHGQASSVENSILQHLTYFQHLASTMAELLETLSTHYDYTQLTDEVLREVSQREFSDSDANGPKSISSFLIRLSELIPRVVMKHMSLVQQLLDNNSFTLRCAVVEVVGNIITDLAKSQEELDQQKSQAEGFIELLEERFMDINPFVRSRAIQGLNKLTEKDVKFVSRRLIWTQLAVRHLEDRAGIVRRNAIKLLGSLILSHPYDVMHGDRLQLSLWQKRLNDAEAKLKELQPVMPTEENLLSSLMGPPPVPKHADKEMKDGDNDSEEDSDDDEENKKEKENDDTAEKETNNPDQPQYKLPTEEEAALIAKVELTVQYYKDAVHFIQSIHKAVTIACDLLYSKTKNEVIDMMNFFVLCDAYGIENATVGIRRMLHLVWMKGNNEEGNAIVTKLIESYTSLYLSAPESLPAIQQASYKASNLIKLTYTSSVSDLASIEKLLCEIYLMSKDEKEPKYIIDDVVVKVLWQFYSKNDISRRQRRGAIIVLGMLAAADNQVSLSGLDLLLNIGLDVSTKDWILMRYSCIALRRIVPSSKMNVEGVSFKISKEKEALESLTQVLTLYTREGEWFGMAEEALNAVYTIASHPDSIASNILKIKSKEVFSTTGKDESVHSLSQLIFLVGHIALKTIIHLEKCEAEFKKKKMAAEAKINSNKDKSEQEKNTELEMIGGTNEDDFADAVMVIKEREVLYGEHSLLARFVPLVKEIVTHPMEYPDAGLQRQTTLCLEKMMCVSPKFCQENLPLYIDIMENSKDAITRSNAVLGLGDMTVCFNNIVDQSKDQLYGRLQDENIMVQRTCLMTVTFLILAGQVKVKGQLAQMAKLLENKDSNIADMCKLFFTELATKDNAIYNGFIDMFSGLAADPDLDKAALKRIIMFVVPFIDKERHKSQLVLKLYQRMLKVDTKDQWEDIAFVLNTLGTGKNEEIEKVIKEGFKVPEAR
ncbi:hypothetical protein B5S28_g1563 [[Candida] boidinii]|nr:hypothetical protein B5S28_g1563 [[Candida] boidinii]OWB61134.1 hypothetical protein B5S29_g2018 [[Candida] boidinii]